VRYTVDMSMDVMTDQITSTGVSFETGSELGVSRPEALLSRLVRASPFLIIATIQITDTSQTRTHGMRNDGSHVLHTANHPSGVSLHC
jgi:hypothetical protein